MHDPRVSLWSLVAVVACLAIGCSDPPAPAPPTAIEAPHDPTPRLEGLEPWSDAWILAHAESYLEDPRARREALEGSLTQPDNLYSQARLAQYGHGTRGWDALPEWSPRTLPIDRARADAIASGQPLEVPDDAPRLTDGPRPTTWREWVALGRRVFREMPLRSEPYWTTALRDPEVAGRLGVERAPDGSVPGLVLVRDLDGESRVGITCALCHSASRPGSRGAHDGGWVDGRARRTLDYGLARIELARSLGRTLDPEAEARFSSWGRGRADVLEELSDVPIAIPDLYALRQLRWLTQGATLRHVTPLALAVRQETQFVQANHLRTRPPRVLVWALVTFLYAIEPPPTDVQVDAEMLRGRAIFERECASCHEAPSWSGDPVALDRIGTHPELAEGHARGTGTYRPSPLVRVSDAAPYLHHGVVVDLVSLLSPDRSEPGHRFGTELSSEERAALISFLGSL